MKKVLVATIFSSALLLSACSGQNASEQLDNVLQETFSAEKEYRDTQSEMEKLEKNEQQLFESIMGLTQEQQEEVSGQAEEAMESADQRLELLKTENESIENAQEEFKAIDAVIEETDEESLKADLTELKSKMQERFESHADFAAAYEELTGLQKELYDMLLNEETELQALQEKAMEVNEKNTAVQETVAVFNERTEQFNEMKDNVIEKLEQEEN